MLNLGKIWRFWDETSRKRFKDGKIIINAGTENFERARAVGCFAVIDVYIEYSASGL